MKVKVDPLTGLPTVVSEKTTVVSKGGGVSTPDASSTVKGKLQLTNDLGGTADAPTVVGINGVAYNADPLAQYALLAGRATPQQFAFGTASGASTGYLTSTAHATKGKYFLNAAGTITVDELNTRFGLGVTSPTTDFTLSGQAARTIQLERHTTSNTAGNNLTISSGGATSGATNKSAGNLILSTGVSTGTGTGSVLIRAPIATSSGTTDVSPSTVVTINGLSTSVSNRFSVGQGLVLGLGLAIQPSSCVLADLVGDITSGATQITFTNVVANDGLGTPSSFPTAYPFMITIDSERMIVTSLASGTSSSGVFNVSRGARDENGTATTAASHLDTSTITEYRDTGYVISPKQTMTTNVSNQTAPFVVFLPPASTADGMSAPTGGQVFLITDSSGQGFTNPITVKDYSGGLIFRETIDVPYGSMLVQFDSVNLRYKIVARYASPKLLGNTLYGNTTSGGNLLLSSTSNATKGLIKFGTLSAYDEVNDRLGLGTTAPGAKLSFAAGTTAAAGIDFGGDVTLYRSAADTLKTDDKLHVVGEIELDGALNHDGTTVGFFGTAPATQQTELTDELTTITHTAPGTPDYAIQDLTNAGGFGFVTQDEGNTVLSVVANLQTRTKEIEDKLVAYGLLVDAD